MKRKKIVCKNKNARRMLFGALLCGCLMTACGKTGEPFDGQNYIMESALVDEAGSDAAADADNDDVSSGNDITEEVNIAATSPTNAYDKLSVPTQITKIGDDYFIVDCYHNQILYNADLETPISDWKVMTTDITHGHTIASDGLVYLVDDTENNRVLIFEKEDDGFQLTQVFENIGVMPHYTAYDADTDTFYVWSSFSGEMYLFRHKENDPRMYLTEIRSVEGLEDRYVRSFTIVGDEIYFVSGLSTTGDTTEKAQIKRCKLSDLSVLEAYDVPDEIAGMAGLARIGNEFYITVSTDLYGSQDAATILRCSDLSDLQKGDYEMVYDEYFVGGGTPYYIGAIGEDFYLTEHRLEDHAIWRFHVTEDGTNIADVESIF